MDRPVIPCVESVAASHMVEVSMYSVFPRQLAIHAGGHVATIQPVIWQQAQKVGEVTGFVPAPADYPDKPRFRLVLIGAGAGHAVATISHSPQLCKRRAFNAYGDRPYSKPWAWSDVPAWQPVYLAVAGAAWSVKWHGHQLYAGEEGVATALAIDVAALHGVGVAGEQGSAFDVVMKAMAEAYGRRVAGHG